MASLKKTITDPFKGILKLFKPDKSIEKEKFSFTFFLLVILGFFFSCCLIYYYWLKLKK